MYKMMSDVKDCVNYCTCLGRLDRENAEDLRASLREELTIAGNDVERHNELSALIKILDRYIVGEVDLMVHPEVILSNTT